MTPQVFVKVIAPLKKELMIVSGIMVVIVMLPVGMLLSATNVGALSNSDNKLYTGSVSTFNTYIFGYCTFWAANRRAEVGKPIPNNWGDARTWDDNAKKAGYTVDHVPGVYSIMQTDDSGVGTLGHVAFVESVDDDGGWKISEMNAVGWNITSPRAFKQADAKNYNFIH